MENKNCSVCLKKPTPLSCDACGYPSCKNCSDFVDEDSFELFEYLPDEIRAKMFCPLCFNEKAEPILIEYQDILERAKSVDVFDKDQGTETRLIKRTEKPLRIVDCSDRKETLMRLAFIAAQKGFDTLVDTNITSRKVTNGRYKKLVWSGTAVPVTKKEKQRP